MSKILRYYITVADSTCKGTVVNVVVKGFYFPSTACSTCGILSDNFPSFRPENKCAVCGKNEVQLVDELDSYLCLECEHDFEAWVGMNPDLPVMDFLREKIND